MPTMRRTKWISCCLALAIGSTLVAQEKPPSPPPRNIEAVVNHALANNAELRVFEAEVAAAKGQRTQAGFFKNPEVSAEIGAREVRDSQDVLQGNGTTLSIAVTQ